jgi:hypothetical protein
VERPTPAPAEAAPPPPRRRGKKGRTKGSAPRLGPWLWLGAAAVLALVGGVGFWLWPGGGVDREAFDLRRTPREAGATLPIASYADPVAWQVKPDGIAPAGGLRSALALPAGWVEAIAFASPTTGQAAVLNARLAAVADKDGQRETRRLEWIRYELHGTEPVGQVTLADGWADKAERKNNRTLDHPSIQEQGVAPLAADLSPDGNVLAFRNENEPTSVEVWKSDGQRLATLKAAEPVDWVGLPDDRHLLVLAGGKLGLRQLPGGEEAWTAEKAFRLPVVFSPGRKAVVAFAGDGFAWVQTADGREIGRLPLPSPGGLAVPPAAAFPLDGRSFAAALAWEDHSDLVVWDVETGRLRDGRRSGPSAPALARVPFVQWCGPRQLLLGGERVYDLDLAHVIESYKPRSGVRFSPSSPDGRAWFTVNFVDKPLAKLKQDYELDAVLPGINDPRLRGAVEKAKAVFGAWTAPHAWPAGRLDAVKKGSVWRQGTAVRIEVVHRDATFRRQAAEKLADALAGQGFAVDPAAELTARLTVPEPVVDSRPKSTGIGGVDLWVEHGELTARLEVVGPDGQVRVSVNRGPYVEPVATEGYAKVLRDKLLADLGYAQLPAFEVRDASNAPVALPPARRMGIDGVYEPAP